MQAEMLKLLLTYAYCITSCSRVILEGIIILINYLADTIACFSDYRQGSDW
jgi:hypothetical protein